MMDIQAEKEEAVKIFRKVNPPKPYPYNQLVVRAYADGIDTGYKIASIKWTVIYSTDDLPKESGEYLFRERSDQNCVIIHEVEIATEDDYAIGGYEKGESIQASYEVRRFWAWTPIPPFTD